MQTVVNRDAAQDISKTAVAFPRAGWINIMRFRILTRIQLQQAHIGSEV
jgi:hypothetical protein